MSSRRDAGTAPCSPIRERALAAASAALDLCAYLNCAGDDTQLPNAWISPSIRGPWGLAHDCALFCLLEAFDEELAERIIDRAFECGEHGSSDLVRHARAIEDELEEAQRWSHTEEEA